MSREVFALHIALALGADNEFVTPFHFFATIVFRRTFSHSSPCSHISHADTPNSILPLRPQMRDQFEGSDRRQKIPFPHLSSRTDDVLPLNVKINCVIKRCAV